MSYYKEALEYHSTGRKGKIEVVPTKPVSTQKDLSLAYSPGVAEPCRMIAEKEDMIYEYTAKGNLVAVVSNGSAVLGLGNLGAAASKPVMEGKGVLFKKFADIDVFDIELNAQTPEDMVRACEMLEPTFGGINLEDIKAPDCFYVEEELKKRLKIPVFHDDQHGTAVISGAAFLNALECVGKKIDQVKVVFCGAGSAGIACANMYMQLGVKPENLLLCDNTGVIYKGRTERMDPYKERFAVKTSARTITEALRGADAFVGLSVQGAITVEMLKPMAKDPIIFAMANPDPEVMPEEILKLRPDALIATGRSDYPNQVNNVLGFPFIFRGALDTRAKAINEEMKMAAVKALAALAKEEVTEAVSRAYGGQKFRFGREYLIPKPFDRRALLWVAPAVAEAAMKSGVARIQIDLAQYRERLEAQLGTSYTVMRGIKRKVAGSSNETKGTIVLPEGEHTKILLAARQMREEGIGEPILIGNERKIRERIQELGLKEALDGVRIEWPSESKLGDDYAVQLAKLRERKGVTLNLAKRLIRDTNYFGAMMVERGEADGLLSGVSQSYPETIKPAIQVIGTKPGTKLSGIYVMMLKKKTLFFADTTVNIDPSAEELADIAFETASFVERFADVEPRVAMLSFSNFGSNNHPVAIKARDAVSIAQKKYPDLRIDGEMQADTAVLPRISQEAFPFNRIPGDANILIFPDLQSGNIAYKLIWRLTDADAIGPILVGMKKPVHVLQQNCDVNDIVNMAAITAMDIQIHKKGEVKHA